jgi:hypothetical protein
MKSSRRLLLRSFCAGSISLSAMLASSSSAMVFLSESATIQDYERFLIATNQQSYTQWISNKVPKASSTAHEKVLEFSQSVLSLTSQLSEKMRNDWRNLRLAEDLNQEDREILLLLAEKTNQTVEICRVLLLQPDLEQRLQNSDTRRPKCDEYSSPLPNEVTNKIRPQDLVQIDGVLFSADQLPKRLVSGSYRWKIFSNTFVDREFVGTAKEFGSTALTSTALTPTRWVQGSCGKASLVTADFSIQSQAKIFFSNACVEPALKPVQTFSTWTEEHKTLLWGLGILAVGLTAYQLRDKNIVFTMN